MSQSNSTLRPYMPDSYPFYLESIESLGPSHTDYFLRRIQYLSDNSIGLILLNNNTLHLVAHLSIPAPNPSPFPPEYIILNPDTAKNKGIISELYEQKILIPHPTIHSLAQVSDKWLRDS